ncbi:MAG: hypothetical protein DBX49_01110 [Clostridia bacterium]|nr:MAG: hypothetical protein DBX49_01110 [Clostridia bacterium]
MLFQPSNISPDEINGSGTVDLTENLTVTWQVSGDSAMTAYQIDFYSNNAASSPLYSTGKISLQTPFWGVNYKGEQQYYSATVSAAALAGAGMTNGSEYKLLITQWWSASDSIRQTTASLFLGRAAPSVAINAIPSPLTVSTYSFTGTYSQAQGDALKWVRWQIAEVNTSTSTVGTPFLDTGKISGTGELRVDYAGLFTGTTYAIKLSIETINGVDADTGWVQFTVNYSVSPATGQVTACQSADGSSVYVAWDMVESAQAYTIFRQGAEENTLFKIADVDSTTGALRDYGARSGESYRYYVFPTGVLSYLTEPMVSEPVAVQFWSWTIIEAAKNTDGTFSTIGVYKFRYGSGGVSEGEFSNNNSPALQKNFTPYPVRQPEAANYLTGSVSGFIGSISGTKDYTDTLAQARALRALSLSTNTLFLLDPKGHFINIHTSEPISMSINHKSPVMPQTLTLRWVEVGTAENVSLTSIPGGDFWPVDEIIFTSLRINPLTGSLMWTRPEEYLGSVLSMDSGGKLIQTTSDAFTAAGMAMDSATGQVTATLPEGGAS